VRVFALIEPWRTAPAHVRWIRSATNAGTARM
jgi:hypothetical protein